jgi:serine protease Do
VSELLTKGEVSPVWIGVDAQDLDGRIAEVMELPRRLTGALVSRVRPDGPAAGSDIARGDVVLRVDGSPVRTAREFYEHLERATTGQRLTLVLWRSGAERSVEITAREIPEALIGELGAQLLGVQLATPGQNGAMVESVRAGSGAAQIGLQAGDRILGINGRRLSSPAVWRRVALDLRGRSHALVVVQRGRGRYHVSIPLS